MNYTDVDDKIIERANLERIPPDEITAQVRAGVRGGHGRPRVEPPDILVRATDHIEDMIEAIGG